MKSIFKVEDCPSRRDDWGDWAFRAKKELARRAKRTSMLVIDSGCGLPLPALGWFFNNDTGRMVGTVLPSGSISEAKNHKFESDLFP